MYIHICIYIYIYIYIYTCTILTISIHDSDSPNTVCIILIGHCKHLLVVVYKSLSRSLGSISGIPFKDHPFNLERNRDD